MFMRHRFLRFFFVGFFALMLIGGLRQARFQNVYNRGFVAGQNSAEQIAPPADGPAINDGPAERGPSYSGDGYYNGYYRGHGFGPFRFLFTFLIFLFFFKFLSRMMWGGRRHYSRHNWKKHWKSHHDGRDSKGFGPFNEFNQYDGRSAKERKYDQDGNSDSPMNEM